VNPRRTIVAPYWKQTKTALTSNPSNQNSSPFERETPLHQSYTNYSPWFVNET